MRYRATLDGRPIGGGSIQETRAAVAATVTGLVAGDPVDYAHGAHTANVAFDDGAVVRSVAERGEWSCSLDDKTLRITREG